MKTLLLGSGGLLGRQLQTELSQHGHDLTALTHAQADITDSDILGKLFQEKWDVVINSAAICDFDACEADPIKTGRVNREAPLDLATRCHQSGATFVQFSSDYVFRGEGDRLLTEEDATEPLSVYGAQKADLERKIPSLCPNSLILRISWLFGQGGRTFMSLLPALLEKEKSLRLASGKHGRCLYAADAAYWVRLLVEQGQTGLLNLVNHGNTSWEEFAEVSLALMKSQGRPTRCEQLEQVPYSELGPNWAKRPRYSCLDTNEVSKLHPPGPRHWREALADFLATEKSFAAEGVL